MTTPPRKPRSGPRAPTLADVARHAGVSPMTVSRVINAEPGVQPALREKVGGAISALGYVPNPAARSLAGGRQCRIALVHANPSAAWLSEVLMGSLAQASRIDAQLVVEQHDPAEAPAALVQRLSAHWVDAVLLPPPLCDEAALLAALHEAGLPLAQIATGAPAAFAHAVTIDDEAAAHAMTAHLIAQGHRRIGFITGAANQTASALRAAGYRRALAEAGLDAPRELVAAGDFTWRSGLAATEALLALPHPPSAIFASNDDMAAAALDVAHRHRLEVPAALAIAGFDDSAMATTVWPELTTIHQPVAEMARRAVQLLAGSVRERGRSGAVQHLRLDFRLVRRGSDGAPPRQGEGPQGERT